MCVVPDDMRKPTSCAIEIGGMHVVMVRHAVVRDGDGMQVLRPCKTGYIMSGTWRACVVCSVAQQGRLLMWQT